jgi:hypothetical protein
MLAGVDYMNDEAERLSKSIDGLIKLNDIIQKNLEKTIKKLEERIERLENENLLLVVSLCEELPDLTRVEPV